MSITPSVWQSTGTPLRQFKASAGVSQSVTFQIGELVANQTYTIKKNGITLRTATANAAGVLSFTDTVGSTAITYSL